MEHVDKNRIHNNIYKQGIQDTEENFNKIWEVIQNVILSYNFVYSR